MAVREHARRGSAMSKARAWTAALAAGLALVGLAAAAANDERTANPSSHAPAFFEELLAGRVFVYSKPRGGDDRDRAAALYLRAEGKAFICTRDRGSTKSHFLNWRIVPSDKHRTILVLHKDKDDPDRHRYQRVPFYDGESRQLRIQRWAPKWRQWVVWADGWVQESWPRVLADACPEIAKGLPVSIPINEAQERLDRLKRPDPDAALLRLPDPPATEDPAARLFASHALALRTAGVAGDREAAEFLAGLPGKGLVDRETLPVLWSPFFANAMVKLGRLRSSGPTALYYDPLLDIAVLTLWEKQGERYAVVSARALPGERLAAPDATAALQPPWMTAEGNLVEDLARIASARLEAFRRMHPAESLEAGRLDTTFAADAAGMRAALPRLAWNAARRLEWAEGIQAWLPDTLAAIEAALGAGDPAALTAAAPDTDAETAAALSRLPAAFAEGLVLDMTLEASGTDRLLVASMPDDGDIYVLAVCRLEGGACALRRFMLMSLFG